MSTKNNQTPAGATKPLSRRDLEIWHLFKRMGTSVMACIESDLTIATGLSAGDFGVLSRLVDLGDGELRQQVLADSLGWHKSRLSHHLSRMQERGLLKRKESGPRTTVAVITKLGRRTLVIARPVHAAAVRRWLLDRLDDQDRAALQEIAAALEVEQS